MAKAKIESVIERAAKDAGFRKALLADAKGALAKEKLELASDESAMLEEYVRVAKSMSAAELEKAIADYLKGGTAGAKRAAGGAGA